MVRGNYIIHWVSCSHSDLQLRAWSRLSTPHETIPIESLMEWRNRHRCLTYYTSIQFSSAPVISEVSSHYYYHFAYLFLDGLALTIQSHLLREATRNQLLTRVPDQLVWVSVFDGAISLIGSYLWIDSPAFELGGDHREREIANWFLMTLLSTWTTLETMSYVALLT
jgi:hypothetical protein